MATEAEGPGRSMSRMPITRLRNGQDLDLVVHRVTGTGYGPRLTMFGGVHGDEPLGSEAVRRVVESVDSSRLAGTIVAVPVANPYAYQSSSRVTPLDGLNLNRVMPGDRDGSVTEQLAAKLAGIIDDGTTHFIDYHSGGNSACVDYAYLHDPGAEMSRAYGCRVLYQHDSYANTTTDYALRHGVPSMVSELGGGWQDSERYLDRAVQGTFNVLKVIGMLPGEPAPPPEGQVIVQTLTVVRPHVGGVLHADVGSDQIGQVVPEGTLLGRIVDPYTFQELEVLRAPYDPTIMVLSRSPVTTVDPGDYGFMVADGATSQPANP